MNIKKSVMLSKTFWFNIAMAFSPLLPGAAEFLTDNTQLVAIGWSMINMLLRKVSKSELTLIK